MFHQNIHVVPRTARPTTDDGDRPSWVLEPFFFSKISATQISTHYRNDAARA